MVYSLINKEINYPTKSGLNPTDENFDTALYILPINPEKLENPEKPTTSDDFIIEKEYYIAIGNPVYDYIDNNIVIYPIYLIQDDFVHRQIGLYEIVSVKQTEILDTNGDIDITRLDSPLFYDDIKSVLQKVNPINLELSPNIEDLEKLDNLQNIANLSPLLLQDETQAELERNAFKKTKQSNWISVFMHNPNYASIDNEGGGDCLFAAIRDGLVRIGETISVKDMRQQLATNATQAIFEGYREMYNLANIELANVNKEITLQATKHSEIKQRGIKSKDKATLTSILKEGESINKKHKQARLEKVKANELLEEYRFMKDVDTLEKFKQVIQTCDFWGDTWAISTLETILNLKLIILSREAFNEKDLNNVLLCGQINDTTIEKTKLFQPRAYIILEYLGDHYKLITYKKRGALTYEELPYDIKKMIVDKCMEHNSGLYTYIPEFKEFMKKLKVSVDDSNNNTNITDINSNTKIKTSTSKSTSHNLYNESCILQYYNRAANKPKVGKGAGEKLPESARLKYNTLESIKNWRRKLSTEHITQFDLDNNTWNSVEHYMVAIHFKKNNYPFYLAFTLDRNPESTLAKDPVYAKAALSKSGIKNKVLIRPKEIKVDNISQSEYKNALLKATRAKFSENDELKTLLLATNDAKLQEYMYKKPPRIADELMEIRKELKYGVKQ